MDYTALVRVKFYLKASGRSPVEEFLNECTQELRGDFFDAINLLALGQNLTIPVSRNCPEKKRILRLAALRRFEYGLERNEH